MTTSNKCQGTIHTCKVEYVAGTSERTKALSDKVLPIISKSQGHLMFGMVTLRADQLSRLLL